MADLLPSQPRKKGRDTQQPFLRQGWLLLKQGTVLKSWKSRWCSLRGGYLYVYKTPQDEVPDTKLSIMSAVIANVEDPGLNFTFSIFWPKFSAHQYFQASSQIEADSWVSVMKKAQSICRASVGNGSMPSLQRAPLLNGLDEQGNGVIHRLAYFGRDQDLQALVEQGPDINLQNIRGDTALHLATSEGREKAVIVLLKAKAQVDAINRKGLTPLHIACLRQNDKLVALLLESGANPHIRHFNGKLAADMTDRKKIREMLNSMISFLHLLTTFVAFSSSFFF
eukprot:TRINITY_DN4924_c0_g1_i3.p1 TRINITY_DN4924_c0_g1~~TRINITY_DN4924_c0_g1_i3.p1  ORF type:complete len:281 (+),score=58.78 TRINITY_DN4924_c0_g1_i3:106-948(+)